VSRRDGASMAVEAVPLPPMPDNLVKLIPRSRFYDPAKLPKGFLQPDDLPPAAPKETFA